LIVLAVVPAMSHGTEALVHWRAGTPRLTAALNVSIGLTVASTLFDLYVMRRGVLIVGDGAKTLADDMRAIWSLMVQTLQAPGTVRRARGSRK